MLEIGQIITMKKAHACGGATWEIVRIGVDIKLQCQTCKRYVNLSRDELKKRAKTQSKDKE